MKFKPEHLKILESLKGKVMLAIKARSEPLTINGVYLYYLKDWITEEVPAKKGMFGHPAYTKLKEIHVKQADDEGTKWYDVVSTSLEWKLSMMQKDRELYLKLYEQFMKFNIKLT